MIGIGSGIGLGFRPEVADGHRALDEPRELAAPELGAALRDGLVLTLILSC